MPRLLLAYLATQLAFTAVDAMWLLMVANPMFQSTIGELLRPAPNLAAAAAFYVLYPAGLLILAVRPAIQEDTVKTAAGLGAVVGLTAYGTFDLTNLTILKGYTVGIAVADMAWGAVVSAIASVAGYFAGRHRG